MSSSSKILIVGAGHGGSQCAISLRSAGFTGEIVLIDSDDAPLPYHKPPLSKKYLLSGEQQAVPLRPESAYAKADVLRIHDSVLEINTQTKKLVLQKTGDINYTQLVLATGARNRSIKDLEGLTNVHSIRTLKDTTALRSAVLSTDNIAILGGGFIGLEVAACLATMGKNVRVIEAEQRVLARVVSPQISEHVQSILTKLGVELITGKLATAFDTTKSKLDSVVMDDDTVLKTELLIVGIGALPNEDLAKSAGLFCNNGIVVDESLRTSDPDIYALGDCARYPHWQTQQRERLESVQNAVDQAKQIALQIAEGASLEYQIVPWFWSDIGPLKLQIAGIRQGETKAVLRNEDDKIALYHLQENRVVCVETINNAKDHMLARKLIIASTQVTEKDILDGPETLKALLG